MLRVCCFSSPTLAASAGAFSPFFIWQADRRIHVNEQVVKWGGKWKEEGGRDLGPTWTPNATLAPNLTLHWEEPEYTSQYGSTIDSFSMTGWYDRYDFGGFVVRLNMNASQARASINQLEAVGFIDRYTRAVRVSTALANPSLGTPHSTA